MYHTFWILWLARIFHIAVVAQAQTREVDVAVIGGGVSGTYAAVRLHDQNRSVVLIEPNDYLGGNTETYIDPPTKTPIDIGVQIFKNTSIVLNYHARFNIPLAKADVSRVNPAGAVKYFDFTTGKPVVNPASSSTPEEQAGAFAVYAGQLARYPYLTSGFYLPDPIPPDLLLPFGLFVQKYNLTATLPTISLFCEGFGDLSTIPTLYIFRYVNADFISYVFENKFLTTAASNNGLLYSAASTLLSSSVLLRSRVTSLTRSINGSATLAVSTPTGVVTIRAKRILSAFPQLLSNLDGWDLDSRERDIFSRFQATGWYTGLLRSTDLPTNLSLQNVSPDTPFNLPALPGVYNIGPSPVSGLFHVYYGNVRTDYSLLEVETEIKGTVARLQGAGAIQGDAKVELATLRSHTPYELRVGVEDIERGFYDRFYALQGYRGTWYTGAAVQRHDASFLWEFTEEIVGNLTKSL